MQNTIPQRLRAKQVSELYGVSKASIWNYAKQGLLHPVRVTKGVTVFDREEVEAFFNGEAMQ